MTSESFTTSSEDPIWIRENPDTVLQCPYCGRMTSVISWVDPCLERDRIIFHCKNRDCFYESVLRPRDLNDHDLFAEPAGRGSAD